METALAELKHRLARLTDLRRAEAVLVWDMQVFMPPGGAPSRAAQLGTLEELIHERLVDDRFGELFEELEPYAASLPHDSDDACLIRVARGDWDRARRVPTELAVEFAEAAAESYEVDAEPLRAVVSFERAVGESSRLTQYVILDAGSRRLEFHLLVDWHERHTLLKACFPLNWSRRLPRRRY